MDKPYIKLNQNFPGIVSLFMYDRDVAHDLSAMGQTIMRRPRVLSVGERELIASFVSKLNDCKFCNLSHAACAKEFLGKELVEEVLDREETVNLSMRMRALLSVAACVRVLDRKNLEECISEAKRYCLDQEIHDAVLVASFFSMCNRYVDGLGTTFKPGEPEEGGRSLSRFGYTMGVRRFISEGLPSMAASAMKKARQEWQAFWSALNDDR